MKLQELKETINKRSEIIEGKYIQELAGSYYVCECWIEGVKLGVAISKQEISNYIKQVGKERLLAEAIRTMKGIDYTEEVPAVEETDVLEFNGGASYDEELQKQLDITFGL